MSKLENMFKERFNSIKKLIQFKPTWLDAGQDFRKIVVDRAYRLMLEVDEVIKIEDKKKNQYIAIGTPFGLIVVCRAIMFGKTIIKYETTKNFVKAYATSVKSDVNFFPAPSGLLAEHGFSYLISSQFSEDIKTIAQFYRESGQEVSDGILPPRPPKAKQEKKEAVTEAPNKELWDKALATVKQKRREKQQRRDEQAKKAAKATTKVVQAKSDVAIRKLEPVTEFQVEVQPKKTPYVSVQPA